MKRLIVISILVAYFVSFTELRQLIKIPQLVEHYCAHTSENKDMTLWQFLALHYLNTPIVDSDYQEDMKLPFKQSDGFVASIIFVDFSSSTSDLVRPIVTTSKKLSYHSISNIKSDYLSSIWQPPQF